MAKSGAKLLGLALILMVIGVPLAYAADNITGESKYMAIRVSVVLCISGAALLLYGLFKLIVGLVKRS